MKLHHVAHARHIQPLGSHTQTANDQRIAPTLELRFIVRATMHGVPLRRSQILLPLLLNENQRPLTTAEREMLQAG